MKTIIKALTVVVLLISVSSIAKADGIDFNGGSGGSLSFTPQVGQVLTVTNAPINLLWSLRTPGTQYSVTSGLLNFTTGAATQVTSNPPNLFCGGDTCAVFGAGAGTNLTLNGNVYNSSNTLIASGNLLSGQFLSGNGTFSSTLGNVTGFFNVNSLNNSLLLALFGDTPHSPNGTLAQVTFDVSFNGTSYSGTIGSTNLIARIQEPATLLLFGSGLLAGAALLRRRLQKGKGSAEEGPF